MVMLECTILMFMISWQLSLFVIGAKFLVHFRSRKQKKKEALEENIKQQKMVFKFIVKQSFDPKKDLATKAEEFRNQARDIQNLESKITKKEAYRGLLDMLLNQGILYGMIPLLVYINSKNQKDNLISF